MRRLLTIFLTLLLSCLQAPGASAQQEVEIIDLKHRTVEQVLPVLQPMVEPGGALSGMNNQLILRASRKNREQLKQILASIDKPLRRLVIRVSQTREGDSSGREASVSGNAGLGGNVRIIQPGNGRDGSGGIEIRRGDSSINARVLDTRSVSSSASGQMVQVVEGGKAFIQIGQSIPVPLRQAVLGVNGVIVTESIVYRDIGQGFYAEPHLAGDRVTLDISPQNDTPGSLGPGSVNAQRLTTTVSGRLGEWISLGGVSQESSNRDRANLGVTTRELRDNRGIWLKVEELP